MVIKIMSFKRRNTIVQNSNIMSHWADDVEMDEFYEELTEDIEIVSCAYQAVARFCKKGGGNKRRKQCFD